MTTWQDLTTARPSRNPADGQALPTLRVVYTPGKPATRAQLRELQGQVPLGRRADPCDGIVLEDAAASRLHAMVEVAGSDVRLVDRSSNGSFVNGRRVQEQSLTDGDVLRLGDSLVVFRLYKAHDDFLLAQIAGEAPSMRSLRLAVARAARGTGPVLILGESGTGKELVARALHEHGATPRGPFVAVNTGAIPGELAESQLFGHVAGAFSGARSDRPGVFRAADGGTLFLDEIGELPLVQQAKLLRALESGEVLPVGSVKPVRCSGRVVAATNRELAPAIEEGRFRGDLFARLAAHVIHTPPLRERREDILPLFASALPSDWLLEPDLAEALLLHPWPYNVRELLQLARHAAAQTAGKLLRHATLAPRLTRPDVIADEPVVEQEAPDRAQLEALLLQTHGQVAAMARILGRSRRQVYRYLEAHGLDVDGFRSAPG
jgi:DNA-binding NtrC family response regulator